MAATAGSPSPHPGHVRDLVMSAENRAEGMARRRRLVVAAVAVGVLAGCAGADAAPGSDEPTESAVRIVQEIIEAQADQDREALVDIFADDVVLALPGGAALVGEQAATHMAGYGSNLTTEITGSAVAHDDGTITVPVTSTSVFDLADTYDLLWTVHLDGEELTRIEEQFVR